MKELAHWIRASIQYIRVADETSWFPQCQKYFGLAPFGFQCFVFTRGTSSHEHMCDAQESLCVVRSLVSPSRVLSPHTAPATLLTCRPLIIVVAVAVAVGGGGGIGKFRPKFRQHFASQFTAAGHLAEHGIMEFPWRTRPLLTCFSASFQTNLCQTTSLPQHHWHDQFGSKAIT